MPPESSPATITPRTLIPIGSVIALTVIIIEGWLWLSAQFNENRWTCRDHEKFVLELKIHNPSLVIPIMSKVCE